MLSPSGSRVDEYEFSDATYTANRIAELIQALSEEFEILRTRNIELEGRPEETQRDASTIIDAVGEGRMLSNDGFADPQEGDDTFCDIDAQDSRPPLPSLRTPPQVTGPVVKGVGLASINVKKPNNDVELLDGIVPGLEEPGSPKSSMLDRDESVTNFDETTNLEIVAMVSRANSRHMEKAKFERSCWGYMTWLRSTSPSEREDFIDQVMCGVILINTFSIGFSLDYSGAFWTMLDVIFTAIYISELVLKVVMLGPRHHFCGKTPVSNIFDASVVAVDLAQLTIQQFFPAELANAPSAKLLRVVRLVRLVRLLRFLRLNSAQDLAKMITGLLGASSTLASSLLLFLMIIYVVALTFRELVGRKSSELEVTKYFDGVPRSMLTVFKCAFGDCNTMTGVHIFEALKLEQGKLGSLYALMFCMFTFMMTVGLFNVISAIFVESTMAAAISTEQRGKFARLADTELWESRVAILVTALLEQIQEEHRASFVASDHYKSQNFEDRLHDLVQTQVDPAVFGRWIIEKRVITALDDLDINHADHAYLFDILDSDNGGSIEVSEMVDGLARLRGEPRRSDIICVDLMVRSIQGHMNNVENTLAKVLKLVQPQ